MNKIFSFIIALMFCFIFSTQAQQFSSQPDPNGPSIVNDLVDVEIHYDGVHTQGVGAPNANMIIAAKLTANLFTPYIGKQLTKVKVYIQNAPVGNNVTVRIYSPGTASAPGAELYSQSANVDSNAWNTITLNTPVTVTGTDLWVGFEGICKGTGFQFWGGTDAGPYNINGQYIFFNGAWTTLVGLGPTLTFNWNVRAIINNVVPVELTSFNADVSGRSVQLNWSTATETNNRGFEIQKKSANQFVTVGFVNGKGTTTQTQNYSFTDKAVPGTYTYRLRQVDLNGASELTKSVEVFIAPDKFELANNYPNPFNPSTKISFNLSVDSKVSLRVYNLLGQEVSSLVNGNLAAGSHEVNFNASNFSTGVYMYKLEAAGIDGQSFTSVKKMLLNK